MGVYGDETGSEDEDHIKFTAIQMIGVTLVSPAMPSVGKWARVGLAAAIQFLDGVAEALMNMLRQANRSRERAKDGKGLTTGAVHAAFDIIAYLFSLVCIRMFR